MNPNTVIESIEKVRAVMRAQIEKLGELSPQPANEEQANKEAASDTATILAGHLAAQLATAAEWLRAVNEVEVAARAKAQADYKKATEAIDVEYQEVK